jgi:hypothetical protein
MMEEVRITYTEMFSYAIAFNIVLGFLFGLFPISAGLKLKNRKYGVFGMISSVVGGAVAGVLLAFPAALIFTWLILRDVPEIPIEESPAALPDESAEDASPKSLPDPTEGNPRLES